MTTLDDPVPPPPPPPAGARARCLDCDQYLWLVDGGWVDFYGNDVCLHRAEQTHVPTPAYMQW